ncbi:MAG: TetR/AcrR family transcriptional regulator [Sciscionella sp.]
MPRVGLNTAEVVAAGAAMADEVGIGAVSLAALAERLGVKPPALYKHVDNLGDLQHRIAALAMAEFGDALRDALQGKSGFDALAGMFTALRTYIAQHPGRYSSTVGAKFQGEDDPLLVSALRVINSIGAVLTGYGIAREEVDHAIRTLRCTIHGFALLQSTNAFQWSNDPDESFEWMIRFIDVGLRAIGGQRP